MSNVENEGLARRCRGRPQVRCDDDTLQVILDAALELFRADGYAGTSMAALAKHAGVSTKTLYRLVPTKEDLFKRLIVNRIGRFILDVGPAECDTADPAAGLERLLVAYANLVFGPDTLPIYRLVVRESGRFPEIGRTYYDDAVRRTATFMAEWLERRCRLGEISLDDPVEAAGMLRGMMVREPERAVLLVEANPPDAAQIEQRARVCARLFLEGCRVR